MECGAEVGCSARSVSCWRVWPADTRAKVRKVEKGEFRTDLPCGECRPIVERTILSRYPWMSKRDKEDLAQNLCVRCVRYDIMKDCRRPGVKFATWVNRQVKHQMGRQLREEAALKRGHERSENRVELTPLLESRLGWAWWRVLR